MIDVKNMGEELFQLQVNGSQTLSDNVSCFVVPMAGVIRGLLARLGTAGITGTQTTDVLINGVSIFSGATLINFASGATVPTYGALTTNPPVVAKGDVIRLNTTAVHSGTPAVNLAVQLTIRRSRESSRGMDSDSVSLASDLI